MRRLVALLLVLTTLVACSGGGDDDAPDDGDTAPTTGTTQVALDGGRLVVGLEAAVAGLDPAEVLTVSELTAAFGVFDPLLAVRGDGDVVPYLAQSFETNDDITRTTILLRDGVSFSDGTPVDAAAVVSSLDRLVASPVLQHLLRPLTSISALGPMAVEITSEPWPELPSLLAGQLGLVVAPSMTDPRQPIGTGPFVVGAWIEGEHLSLTANESYWRGDDDLPFVDELDLRFLPDASQRVALLERGELDVVHVSGDDAVRTLRAADGVTFSEPASSERAVVVLVDDEVPCAVAIAAVAAESNDECEDDLAFTVRTDLSDEVVAPVVDRWEDAGFDVTVETADAASIAIDRLVGDLQVVLTVDDGLLPMGRPDGSSFVQTVVESIPWAYGSGAKVGGVLGSIPLPDDDGETRPVPGIVVLAALHRTR